MHDSRLIESCDLRDAPLVESARQRNSLLGCMFEITARCNNDCRHCYINLKPDDIQARNRELSAERIGEISEEAASMGALFAVISGGEPLLRPDFADIYLTLKRNGLVVSVMTNAGALTEEHIRLFEMYPPRNVEVTVYGVTQPTYEKVTRQPGSYTAFIRGLNMLLESKIAVRLKAMALRSNVHELGEIAEFCRARTEDYFRFDPWLHLRYDGDMLRNEEIISERLSAEEFVATEMADVERRNGLTESCNKMVVNKQPANLDEGKQLVTCGAGNCECTIGYDGSFRLCSSLHHPECIGDLRSGSLATAYESVVPKVRAMRSMRKEFLDKCGQCSIINFCLWCPAHAYLETGELDMPVDYFCDVAHARAQALGLDTATEVC